MEYEDLLATANPQELTRLFTLVAEGRLSALPIRSHADPFVQQLQDLLPLSYNPLPRFTSRSRRVELLTPLSDAGYRVVAASDQVGRIKEYRYLFSANSFIFEACSHLLAISSFHTLDQQVARGLITV